MSKAGDKIAFLLFKQVAGGHVFRAPNPWVFGPVDHFLVNEAQRDEILAIITPRRPMLLLVVWIGGFLLALAAAIASLHAVVTDYPVTSFLVLIMATLLVAILALHLSASRKRRQLQPILAGVPRTDQRITIAEIRRALNQGLSYRQLRRAAILQAIAFVISAASLAFMLYFRKPHASLLADPVWLAICFNTIMVGFSSASSYLNALQKTEHADGIRPAADPTFNRSSRYLVSAWALALLVVAAIAGIGVKREFSDQSQGLRYAARGKHDGAIASLSKAVTAEPNNSDAYMDRARSYGAKGDQDGAIADYTKAIEIKPGDAIAYRKRADAYRAKGALDNAIADYSKAIELDPKGSSVYFFRGIAYAANKSNDHAIADFTKAIEIDPKDTYSYVSRARSFEAKGDHDHAIADFNKAIEINPTYANAYYSRGISYAANNHSDRAIADFTTAIGFNPGHANAYYSRGISHATNKNSDLAIADFNKAIELNPKDAYSYVSRARSFGAKGDHDQATADLSKAIEINPKYYHAYVLRGDTLEAKGERDRAIGDFTRAIEIEPKKTAAYSSRAAAYVLTGARSLAIADYKTILELPAVTNADRQGQRYARQRIDQLTSALAPAGASTNAPTLVPR